MKKSVVSSIALLSLGLLLAGCGSSSADKSDNAGKSAKTTQAGKTSSSKKDDREITNGPLLKVGQWSNDEDMGKITLTKITAPENTVAKDGPVEFKIKDVKLFKAEPKTKAQRSYDNDYFSTNGVTNPFYYVQIQFNAKNTSANEVQVNGVKSLVTSTGQQISQGQYLNDESVGETLAANANSDYVVQALIKTEDQSKIDKFTINFDSVANTDTYEDIGTAQPLELPFK
ncbi:hypothetical protein LFYK43_10710 [Ligilactobacillus salitolerans]|uniref:Lipoprotein n=1 Tax=Ligilactobacillus salitolerans TaxID=1808352 RepID=A0A401ISU7_9LACO|nr:hypothetical protein [Ligilactobacillus salitolerans]GBG94612.1 hypothetical protein LFYK43_10710 [Ligilactobacillus salitolerans]